MFSSFEDVVEVSDVADGQSQNLDFGQFFIRGQCRQQFAQFAEGDVERLNANAFARRVRRPVLLRGSPTTPTLLSSQRRRLPATAATKLFTQRTETNKTLSSDPQKY